MCFKFPLLKAFMIEVNQKHMICPVQNFHNLSLLPVLLLFNELPVWVPSETFCNFEITEVCRAIAFILFFSFLSLLRNMNFIMLWLLLVKELFTFLFPVFSFVLVVFRIWRTFYYFLHLLKIFTNAFQELEGQFCALMWLV